MTDLTIKTPIGTAVLTDDDFPCQYDMEMTGKFEGKTLSVSKTEHEKIVKNDFGSLVCKDCDQRFCHSCRDELDDADDQLCPVCTYM